jgi:hypothetical protein
MYRLGAVEQLVKRQIEQFGNVRNCPAPGFRMRFERLVKGQGLRCNSLIHGLGEALLV